MLGYFTLGSEGEQTLLAPLWFHRPTPTSCSKASWIQSSLCTTFLSCFPNNTIQFSTTALHMTHKISLFARVMYLHLLLPGIWWNSFLLLTSPLGLGWLKFSLAWAVLAWMHTLLFQLVLPTVASEGPGCFPPACKVSNTRCACYSRELVNKKLNEQGNPEDGRINNSIW